MKTGPLIVEQVYNASVEKVWEAITNKEQMKEWYFDLSAFEPVTGFEFQFTGNSDCGSYLHLCKIIEVLPMKKLSYSWRYDTYPGNSVVTFELFPEGEKTRLKLTHEGLETFPANTKDFTRGSFEEGWNYILGTSLKDFSEKAVSETKS